MTDFQEGFPQGQIKNTLGWGGRFKKRWGEEECSDGKGHEE